jgi:hypothetical protein
MTVGYPLQGSIYYQVESDYGDGMQAGASVAISDAIENVRLESGEINMELRTISSPTIAAFAKANEDYSLHLEFVLQEAVSTSLVSWCVNRDSCDIGSLAFMYGVNTTCGDASWYNIRGAKCRSLTISADRGDFYKVTADFSVASVDIAATSTGTAPDALGTDFAAFNVAGGITWSGVTGAYVTDSFTITVDNDLEDLYDVGSPNKRAAIPKQKKITGSCDISLDGGGGTHFSEVVGGTDITSLAFDTGVSGTITLTNGRFNNTQVNQDTTGGILNSVPFTFQDITLS